MWSPILAPGRLTLLNGNRRHLRAFNQELAHHTLRSDPGSVLWCDGDHGFNPYDFAELNLVRGQDADYGAGRMLIKRCMTPFQWDTVLTQQLQEKLVQTPTAAVLVIPFDRLFSTDELKDWEQEDYVAYCVKHLRRLAHRHQVPILLSVEMRRWWHSHPVLAQTTYEAAEARWTVRFQAGRFVATHEATAEVLDPLASLQVTLWDYAPRPVALPIQAQR